MLLMPRIHRRQIERLKSNRSIRVYSAERIKPLEKERPKYGEKRLAYDRRKKTIPVKQDRRQSDRRNAFKKLRPEIRSLLENAGDQNPGSFKRGGIFIDEDV